MPTVAHGLTWLWSAYAIKIPLVVLTAGLLARLLLPEEMGQYGLLIAVATFLNSVLLNWLQAPFILYAKDSLERNGSWWPVWRSRLPLVFASMTLVLVTSLPPVAWLWALALELEWNWTLWALVFFGTFSFWLQAETSTLAQVLERFSLMGAMPIFQQIFWGSILICIAVVSFPVGPQGLLGLSWLTMSMASIVILLWLAKIGGAQRGGGYFESAECQRISTGAMARHGFPVIGAMLVGYLSYYGDHWLIKLRLTVGDVGQFLVAYQVFLLISGLTTPLSQVLLPKIIREEVRGTRDIRREICVIFPAIHIGWLMFIVLVASLIPEGFLLVFTDRYANGLPVVIVLLSGAVFALLSSTYSTYFNLQSRLGRSALLHLILTSTNLVISWILLPILGIMGSAMGTAFSLWLGGLLYILDQQTYYKIWERGQIFSGFFAASIVLLYLPLLDNLLGRLAIAIVGSALLAILARRKLYFATFDFSSVPLISPSIRRLLLQMFVPRHSRPENF